MRELADAREFERLYGPGAHQSHAFHAIAPSQAARTRGSIRSAERAWIPARLRLPLGGARRLPASWGDARPLGRKATSVDTGRMRRRLPPARRLRAGARRLVRPRAPDAGREALPGLPEVEPVEPAGRPASGRAELGRIVRSIGPAGACTPTSARGSGRARRSGSRSPSSARRQPKKRVSFEYADESDRGPYPIPRNVKIEGGRSSTGDRHAIIVDRELVPPLRAVRALPKGNGWRPGPGRSGTSARTSSGPPAGRRRMRPAWRSSPGSRATTRSSGRDRPRAPLHGAAHPPRLRLPGTALREQLGRSESAADGAPAAAEGELRRERLPAPGADRARCAQALRNARLRQRLELVHHRRAGPRWSNDQLHTLGRSRARTSRSSAARTKTVRRPGAKVQVCGREPS